MIAFESRNGNRSNDFKVCRLIYIEKTWIFIEYKWNYHLLILFPKNTCNFALTTMAVRILKG
jgi:hypothetical protein